MPFYKFVSDFYPLITSYLTVTRVFLSYQHLPVQLYWTFFHTMDIQQVLLVNPCHEKLNNSGKKTHIEKNIFIFPRWSHVEVLTVDIISRIILHQTRNQVPNLVNTSPSWKLLLLTADKIAKKLQKSQESRITCYVV